MVNTSFAIAITPARKSGSCGTSESSMAAKEPTLKQVRSAMAEVEILLLSEAQDQGYGKKMWWRPMADKPFHVTHYELHNVSAWNNFETVEKALLYYLGAL